MAGERRSFGSVVVRRRRDGSVQSFLARYAYEGVRVQRAFRDVGAAEEWLESERLLVESDRAGVSEWSHPSRRARSCMLVHASAATEDAFPVHPLAGVSFVEWADRYVDSKRLADGSPLRGKSMRNIRCDVGHLKDAFPEPLLLRELSEDAIRAWYEGDHPEGPWTFRRECQRLRAMLEEACDPGMEGGALLASNPFRFPIPRAPVVESHDAPPVTSAQLKALYEAMPAYTRISVLLVAVAGGMRTGEVCALRVGDFDFDLGLLHIRHSVDRGPDDRGSARLSPTKTERSRRTVPLPAGVVPLVRAHIREYCDGSDPNAPLLVAKRAGQISQGTLAHQVRVAREKAGRADLTLRLLRASHATLYMLEGGSLRETMDQLGHVTEEVAIQHYQRVVPSHRRQIADRVAEGMLAGLAPLPEGVECVRVGGRVEPDGGGDQSGEDVAGLLRSVRALLERVGMLLGGNMNIMQAV